MHCLLYTEKPGSVFWTCCNPVIKAPGRSAARGNLNNQVKRCHGCKWLLVRKAVLQANLKFNVSSCAKPKDAAMIMSADLWSRSGLDFKTMAQQHLSFNRPKYFAHMVSTGLTVTALSWAHFNEEHHLPNTRLSAKGKISQESGSHTKCTVEELRWVLIQTFSCLLWINHLD